MNIVVLLGVVITLATGIPVLLQILRNHPRGLIICFFAEMWERFSYYGMRGLLIFYLTQHFLFGDGEAGSIYGSYTSLVYLVPLLGGILADRFIGTRKAIAFGAVLLVAGHGMMAFEGKDTTQNLSYAGQTYQVVTEGRGDTGTRGIIVDGKSYHFDAGENGGLAIEGLPAASPLPAELAKDSYTLEAKRDPLGENVFFLAISLIIMGVGFLKPNISTLVGQLYPQGDPRRDAGFTLYYYGINLGSFWAAVLCGLLGQTVGWWAGFGLAGLGMLAGLIVFVLGKPLLQGKGEPPVEGKLKAKLLGPINREYSIYLLGLLGVIPVWFMVQRNALVGTVLGIATILSLAFIGYVMMRVCKTWAERQRMMLAVVLIFGSVIFFTLFEQAGTSLNLFADRNVDLNLLSAAVQFGPFTFGTPAQIAAAGLVGQGMFIDTTMTASQTQSFNAGFILIFAPIFAALWVKLGRAKRDPDPTFKFGLGLLQVGLGFMVVVWGAGLTNSAFQMPIVLLALLYMFHTTGELFLSPVGLSQITKLSMPQVVSFMMAVWFLASSIAQYVGGWIAGLAGTETVGGQVLNPQLALQTSLEVFEKLGWAGLAAGVLFIIVSFFIKGWANGANGDNHPGPVLTEGGHEDGNIAAPRTSTSG
ncbi:POT family proton-dependent oligopeptide transporter [Brevundimonas nasdae]|jgi:proton-dependent oligopeptide transporter, POT family|uniref:Oligopeptide:H+ symporter n=1 Tax=Brevundimonas nasdae TaxID=172043 RepID=A0ABX8TDV9_9CAUL|nr:oligopeptide:H+ symporter [Brevundimonas nasdae]MBK6023484.1 MFS transporter [Brevundimonas nasdae]MDQ0450133.1 POT family proton-dependent oligopeptide transporter [Brevundimonas nasdae]QYC09371.1 oligopeptide:H+ symporter [Brevundimonas nasdae]QYC15419.1 oligopeptide:H+ symporter [Brevundimonas nasdae]